MAFLGTEGSIKAGILMKAELRACGFDVYLPDPQLQQKVNTLIYDRIKESDTLDQDLYFEILEEVTHKSWL